MTPTEVAALDGIDLERGQKRLAEMGIAESKPTSVGVADLMPPQINSAAGPNGPRIADKLARKPRSDKGKPKPKPAQPPAPDFAHTLKDLAYQMVCAELEASRAQSIASDARRKFHEAVDAAGKGK